MLLERIWKKIMAYMFNNDKSKKQFVVEDIKFYYTDADAGSTGTVIPAGDSRVIELKSDTAIRSDEYVALGITRIFVNASDVVVRHVMLRTGAYSDDANRYNVRVDLQNTGDADHAVTARNVQINYAMIKS